MVSRAYLGSMFDYERPRRYHAQQLEYVNREDVPIFNRREQSLEHVGVELETPPYPGPVLGPQKVTPHGVAGSARPQSKRRRLLVTTGTRERRSGPRENLTLLPPADTKITRRRGTQDQIGSVGMTPRVSGIRGTLRPAREREASLHV